eukprot:TRINITY_DN6450_c0_g1_i1.p1 TRINITY_DN6450_c0_g1~~TRINITY_DN6450_c0_g1_i1.p1  ORF type:complete len:581 (+),score=84.97 TRINITY_DN6450_c0_g1_i1:154-1743(+)
MGERGTTLKTSTEGRRKEAVTETEKTPNNSTSMSSTCTTDPDAVLFMVGNPTVETTTGFLHLFKDNDLKPVKRGQLPAHRGTLIAFLAVPALLSIADFCQFIGAVQKHISHLRILRDPKSATSYMVIAQFREQILADQFFTTFHGKQFNSLEAQLCHLGFVQSVEYVDVSVGEGAFPAYNQTELPTCPVCLERLDDSVTGQLTILCNHTFHCLCLAKWRGGGDTTCPVCRYCQDAGQHQSQCWECTESESLWICLICGHVGCGRYKAGHANGHYEQSQHTYALELETQRVWDYLGDNYVHRLIQNKADGKLVELSGPNELDSHVKEEIIESKRTAVSLEYTYLLTSQLETQRDYWEKEMEKLKHRRDTQRSHLEAQIKEANTNKELLSKEMKEQQKVAKKKYAQLQKKYAESEKEIEFLKQCNDMLKQNQDLLKEQTAKAEAVRQKQELDNQQKMKELEDQVRDLMFFIDATKKIEQSVDKEDLRQGTVTVGDAPKPVPRRGPRNTRNRAKKTATGPASPTPHQPAPNH